LGSGKRINSLDMEECGCEKGYVRNVGVPYRLELLTKAGAKEERKATAVSQGGLMKKRRTGHYWGEGREHSVS